MDDQVNGHDIQVPPQVQEVIDGVPHFGDAWKQEQYTNPDHPGSRLSMIIPPLRLQATHKPRFFSTVTINTTRGPIEVGFEIKDASTLHEAEANWRASAQQAIREAHQQLQQNQKRILVPDAVPPAPFKKLLTH